MSPLKKLVTLPGVGRSGKRIYGDAGIVNNVIAVFTPVLGKHSKSFPLIGIASRGKC